MKLAKMPGEKTGDSLGLLTKETVADIPRIISGESGASGVGAALALLCRPENRAMAAEIGLGKDSNVLCISTEGATDRERYRDITWYGSFAAPDIE